LIGAFLKLKKNLARSAPESNVLLWLINKKTEFFQKTRFLDLLERYFMKTQTEQQLINLSKIGRASIPSRWATPASGSYRDIIVSRRQNNGDRRFYRNEKTTLPILDFRAISTEGLACRRIIVKISICIVTAWRSGDTTLFSYLTDDAKLEASERSAWCL
jgi:hypothetical protein